MSHSTVVEQILDAARWAPSGDNTQPWRFEIIDEQRVVVHGFDTREQCVYDLDGRPSQMALGALLETMAIAATTHGLRATAVLRPGCPDTHPTFDIAFAADPTIATDPLAGAIVQRSVQRLPMQTRPLVDSEREQLQTAAGAGFGLRWIDGWAGRWRTACLLFRSAHLRLTIPEAYRVHRDVIEWNARYSVDRVPDQALGASWATRHLMRFAMASWGRVEFFNRFLAGTWIPRLEMDFLPGLACAAHFVLLADRPPVSVEEHVAAGRAMQRVWLTATRLGLMLQPELTPLIFARYARRAEPFSSALHAMAGAQRVARDLEQVMGANVASRGVFVGRVGAAPAPRSRSLRKDLAALRHQPAPLPRAP